MSHNKHMRIIAAIVFLLIAGFVIYLHVILSPIMKDLASASVTSKASSIINDAIESQLAESEIDYDKIVLLEKDVNGKITALKTNIVQVNRLKSQTLAAIDRLLLDLDVSQIGVPLGNLILPELFSGTGPVLPVRIVSVSNSDAEFRNVFIEAGINQTTHQIMLDVSILMTVLTPAGALNVSSCSSVVVAETVIVGDVPNSYVNLG